MVRRDALLIVVKEWMGHAAIETTIRYARLAPDNLLIALETLDMGDRRGRVEACLVDARGVFHTLLPSAARPDNPARGETPVSFFTRLFAALGLWFASSIALGALVVAVGGRVDKATSVTLSLVILIASLAFFFRRRRITGDAKVTDMSRHGDELS